MSKREGMKCSLSHMDFDFVLGSRALEMLANYRVMEA